MSAVNSVWSKLAGNEFRKILKIASSDSKIKKRGPPSSTPWSAEVSVVGVRVMKRLNAQFREKRCATDVLSFPAPPVFFKAGHLGELAICLPVLKKQAAFYRHSPSKELRILLVHGLLHLLGFDHECGPRAAQTMARAEGRLLKACASSRAPFPRAVSNGLIGRSQ